MLKSGVAAFIKFMSEGKPPDVGYYLKYPTSTVAELPDDVLHSLERLNKKYHAMVNSHVWLIVGLSVSLLVVILLAGYRKMPEDAGAFLVVAYGLGVAGTMAFSFASQARAGDYRIANGLVCAIAYIDKNAAEWPDTAHKYHLSQLIDEAAKSFPVYIKQLSRKVSPQSTELGQQHMFGLASLKDEVSVSDQRKILAIRTKLVRQTRLFALGKWHQMLSADHPPKDQTKATKRHVLLQAFVVVLLLVSLGGIGWFYQGQWAGTLAAAALVIGLLALVFMFVPKFANAFSTTTAAIKGVKDVALMSNEPDDEPEAESADKP